MADFEEWLRNKFKFTLGMLGMIILLYIAYKALHKGDRGKV